jgi:hypothetical protein
MWRVLAMSIGLLLTAALLLHVAAVHLPGGASVFNDRPSSVVNRGTDAPNPWADERTA